MIRAIIFIGVGVFAYHLYSNPDLTQPTIDRAKHAVNTGASWVKTQTEPEVDTARQQRLEQLKRAFKGE